MSMDAPGPAPGAPATMPVVPENCILWQDPDHLLTAGAGSLMEIVKTYYQESHDSAMLRRCSECGQLWLYRFYEEIDWKGGEDPTWRTWLPVASAEEADRLCATSWRAVREMRPVLLNDWPKGAPQTAFWLRGGAA